jgi:Flp pilus assembly pilin Flp
VDRSVSTAQYPVRADGSTGQSVGNKGEKKMSNVVRFVKEEAGQDMIEYSLLAGFISIVAWQVINAIGGDVLTVYNGVKVATGDASAAVP